MESHDALNKVFYSGSLDSGQQFSLPVHESVKQIVTVELEIDLLQMIMWNRFLGENFIKCIFRYHASLPAYILELFYNRHVATFKKGVDRFALDKLTDLLTIKVNLKLVNHPEARDSVTSDVWYKSN